MFRDYRTCAQNICLVVSINPCQWLERKFLKRVTLPTWFGGENLAIIKDFKAFDYQSSRYEYAVVKAVSQVTVTSLTTDFFWKRGRRFALLFIEVISGVRRCCFAARGIEDSLQKPVSEPPLKNVAFHIAPYARRRYARSHWLHVGKVPINASSVKMAPDKFLQKRILIYNRRETCFRFWRIAVWV